MKDQSETATAPRLGPLPPFARIDQFMSERDHAALLDYVLANSDLFGPAMVTKGPLATDDEVDLAKRICSIARDLGAIGPMIRERFMAVLPELMAQSGTLVSADWLEIELAAHGEGAFFIAHTDISIGASRRPLSDAPDHDRKLSAVYYFHNQPKQFSGGQLQLFRFGADPRAAGQDPANRIAIDPVDNLLVAFPSWVQHEVTRVSCPSDLFEDRRFAINCWYCDKR